MLPFTNRELELSSLVFNNKSGAIYVLADSLQEKNDHLGEYLVDPNIDLNEKKRKISYRLFRIDDSYDTFCLHNIYLNDNLYMVYWRNNMLDDEGEHRQDDWIELTRNEEWKLPSGLVYYASLAALHYNQNHPDKKQKNLIVQCREMHAQDFEERWMMTSTRIIYTPHGKDTIIHDYGSLQPQEINVDLIGESGKFIHKNSGLENEIKALLGTNDLEEVEQVYKALTGREPRLWRLDSRRKETLEQVLVLGIGFLDGYFDINAKGFYVNDGVIARMVEIDEELFI
ncbi:MAG: hypothetical protein Q8R37_03415 [Nanoarchaeota archaeon]|nr:hypothetical protein [Nanoarchaeota archaeon]